MTKKRTTLNKDNPERKKRDLQIAELRLQGKSVREIGKEVGLGPSQVSSILSDSEIRKILDREMRVYAAHARGIGKEFLKLCYDEDKHIRLKAIEGYHKIMGMTPAHTQNLFIQNLRVEQNNIVDPEFLEYLSRLLNAKQAMPIPTESTEESE